MHLGSDNMMLRFVPAAEHAMKDARPVSVKSQDSTTGEKPGPDPSISPI